MSHELGCLVITIKPGEQILIGESIILAFPELKTSERVRIIAPKSIQIDRQKVNGELYRTNQKK